MRVAESKVSASAVKWRGATFTCPAKEMKSTSLLSHEQWDDTQCKKKKKINKNVK
jgi:hypothetical protein